MNRVLFISPHPDDETLGCGGTILKHIKAGDAVFWLIMTNLFAEAGFDTARIKERQIEIESVASGYGFKEIFKLDFPTTRLDIIEKGQLIKTISDIFYKVKPEIVYLPNGNDVHSDHKITFDVAFSSAKTFRCPSVKRLLIYEVPSETDFSPAFQACAFVPNSFSDISDFLDRKLSIMNIYKGEMYEHPFPRSEEGLKALATVRGAAAGVKYAEAFVLLKENW